MTDGSSVEANEMGTIKGMFITDRGNYNVTSRNVLIVPRMQVNPYLS